MERIPAGSSRFGKYLLLDRIGTGGMSEVFLAKTEGIEGFERKVALKRIFSSLTEHEEFVRSFIHEAKVGGMLYHHNVVQTLDFGRCDGTYFIALEYIEGTNLAQLLHRCREERLFMPPGIFLQLALQICEGLDYIHHATVEGTDLKLVHRDIKPSNMLISTQGLVKISDFGVVKAERSIGDRTIAGSVKGTIGYMSPEQARGADVSPASDQFSFGAMLYEMATLRRLFGDGDDIVLLNRVRDTAFQVPIEAANNYIPGLDRVLRRMLSQDLRNRYADLAQVAEALRALPVAQTDRPTLVQFVRSLHLWDGKARESGQRPALEPHLDLMPSRLPSPGVAYDASGAQVQARSAQQWHPRMPPLRDDPRDTGARSTIASVRDSGPRATPEVTMDREFPVSGPIFSSVRGETRAQRQSMLVAVTVILLGLAGAAGSYYVVDRQLSRHPAAPPPGEIQQVPRPAIAPGRPVTVDLQTVPATAEILVDGVLVATSTPVQLPVYDGQQVRVRLDGYRQWLQIVHSDPSQPNQQWVVTLQPGK